MTCRSSLLPLFLVILYCTGATTAPPVDADPSPAPTPPTTTKATTTKAPTTTTTTTKKPTTTTTTTTTTTPKPPPETMDELTTDAWTTASDPPDADSQSQSQSGPDIKTILLGLSAALNVILIIVIIVGVVMLRNRMKSNNSTNNQDKYYYTHNTPGTGKPQTPTTYDAIEASQNASQPHQQKETPDEAADIDYEPVEIPDDKHTSVANEVVSDQYLDVVSDPSDPTVYQNVASAAADLASAAADLASSSQQSTPKPKPKPKPRLQKESSADSYTDMYSYTAVTSPRNENGATDSIALDTTVPPPPEEDMSGPVGNNLYYNQDAIAKTTSTQHALKQPSPQTPESETDENLYCNESAFIRGKR